MSDDVVLHMVGADSRIYSWALRHKIGTRENGTTIRCTEDEAEGLRRKIAEYGAAAAATADRRAMALAAAAEKVSGRLEAAPAVVEAVLTVLFGEPSRYRPRPTHEALWASLEASTVVCHSGSSKVPFGALSLAAQAKMRAVAPLIVEQDRQRRAAFAAEEEQRRRVRQAEDERWQAEDARRREEKRMKREAWKKKQEQPRPSLMASVWVPGDQVRIEWASGDEPTKARVMAVAGSWLRLSVGGETWIVHMDHVRRAVVTP